MGQDTPGRDDENNDPYYTVKSTTVNRPLLQWKHPSDHRQPSPHPSQGNTATNQVHNSKSQLSAITTSVKSHHDGAESIDPSIPLPRVDYQIVAAQENIFKNSWPMITDEARRSFPQFAALYDAVKSFNLPNFLGARKTVPSELKLKNWERELSSYHDREICYFLRYGWPVGYHLQKPPVSAPENHPSARNYPKHLRQYIETELSHRAIVGPFKSVPFTPWTRLSPLMTRPKRDSDKRRVIVDMSFPEGEAVNDGIKITSIYGRDTTYTLPSIQDLAALIQQAPSTAWVWKADRSTDDQQR